MAIFLSCYKIVLFYTDTSSEEAVQPYLFVKSGKQIHRVDYNAILYLEALKEYIAIHTPKEKLLVYKRMKEVAEQLPEQFIRIHNSYIINVQHIQDIDAGLVRVNGHQLPVSSSYKEGFIKKIGNQLL